MSKTTIIAVDKEGLNIAKSLIEAKLFPEANLIVCDSDERTLKKCVSLPDTETVRLNKNFGVPKSYKLQAVEAVIEKVRDISVICCSGASVVGGEYGPLISLASRLNGKTVFSIFSSIPYKENSKPSNRSIQASSQFAVTSNLRLVLLCDKSSSVEQFISPVVETIQNIVEANYLEDKADNNIPLDEFIPEQNRNKTLFLKRNPDPWFTKEQIIQTFDNGGIPPLYWKI